MSEAYSYGARAYTGSQLLERIPNQNRPRYNLVFTTDQQAKFADFCTEHHLGGSKGLPSPAPLFDLLGTLGMLNIGEQDLVLKELLRRLVSKIASHPASSKAGTAEEGTLYHGTPGALVGEAFAMWKKSKEAKKQDKGKGKVPIPKIGVEDVEEGTPTGSSRKAKPKPKPNSKAQIRTGIDEPQLLERTFTPNRLDIRGALLEDAKAEKSAVDSKNKTAPDLASIEEDLKLLWKAKQEMEKELAELEQLEELQKLENLKL